MIVYRLETQDGIGPFRGKRSEEQIDFLIAFRAHFNALPCPHDDLGSNIYAKEWLCGCATQADLNCWFPPSIRAGLARFGYAISVYNATLFDETRLQVVFDRSTSLLLDRVQ